MNDAIPQVFPRIAAPPRPGRQLFGYHLFLLLLIVVTKVAASELSARFDIAVFPRLLSSVQLALDHTGRIDEAVHTVVSLLYSFLFSLPIAIVYGVTKGEKRFDPSLAQTTVLLSMVVTGVMLVIADQMARAFGLAGVVAAVRFRNSLDDAKDAVYVFLAIVIGMACGARVYPIALCTSVIMTTVLYLMWRYRFGQLPGQLLASPEAAAFDRKHRKGKKEKKGKKDKTLNAAPVPPDPKEFKREGDPV